MHANRLPAILTNDHNKQFPRRGRRNETEIRITADGQRICTRGRRRIFSRLTFVNPPQNILLPPRQKKPIICSICDLTLIYSN